MRRFMDRIGRVGWAFFVSALVFCTATPAQSRVHIVLPSQPLAQSLEAIGSATNTDVGFDAAEVSGMLAPSLDADFTVDDALKRVLEGTGLKAQHLNDHTIVIVAKRSDTVSEKDLSEIVVTGSHIRGVVPAGSEFITIDRSSIDRSGYSTIQDVIHAIPQNFGGADSETAQVTAETNSYNTSYASSANLRGLGADATLTLVNGHRLAPAGFGTFTDISAIPLNLVDRVEVIPDGASAIYGSDAVGGVVNIILKQQYSGADSHLRVSTLAGNVGHEFNAGQTIGKTWDTGNVVLGYEYDGRAAVDAGARPYTANSDLTPFGGTNFDSEFSNPGNITAIGNTPVALAIPKGQNGSSLSAGQLLNGQMNLQNVRLGTSLIPDQRRNSLVLLGSQDITPSIHASAQMMYSDRRADSWNTAYGATITVPESNAYRIRDGLFAGQGDLQENYSFRSDIGNERYEAHSHVLLALLGAELDLAHEWKVDISVSDARTRETDFISGTLYSNIAALDAALASSNLATAFNPFGDGSNSSPGVIASIRGYDEQALESEVRALDFKTDGPVLRLPAGELKVAAGGEFRHEGVEYSNIAYAATGIGTDITGNLAGGSRRVYAAFAEAAIPLLSGFDASVSGRYEHYSDAGSSSNPKLGLHWQATRLLGLRSTYGTSFKAPFIKDLHYPSFAFTAAIPASLDPGATGPITNTLFLAGGNPNLKPERARSWTSGFDLSTPMPGNFKLSTTYFDTLYRDRIAYAAANDLLVFDQPQLYPGVLIRNPTQAQVNAAIASVASLQSPTPTPGSINAIINDPLQNVASIHVRGVDFSVSTNWHSPIGEWSSSLDLTHLGSFDQRSTSAAPTIHQVNTLGNPVKNRARMNLSWSDKGFGLGGFVNYVGSYRTNPNSNSAPIASWTTFDLQVNFDFSASSLGGGVLGKTQIALSVVNLLDRDPPFANGLTGYGYDEANANPYGRLLALDLRHRW